MNSIIDLERYPLQQPQSAAMRDLIARARENMSRDGALQLPGFIRASALARVVADATRAGRRGHRMQGRFNAYSDDLGEGDDKHLPGDHPRRLRLPASHSFVAGDLIASDNPLREIYRDSAFVDFIRRALGVAAIYPIADPLGCINLLAYAPGDRNGWHFDTNDFIVALMLQTAEAGGDYQYIPWLRSDDDENLAAVSWRMSNPDAENGLRRVDLQAGSLFLFRGKHTLHRVTEVGGERDRIVAILSYHPSPGHRLSDGSKLAMYGRTD